MSDDAAKRVKKLRKYVLIGGIVLGLVCKSLPPKYHVACETLAKVCTGGLLP